MSYDLEEAGYETDVLLRRVEALRVALHRIAERIDGVGALLVPPILEELDRGFVQSLDEHPTGGPRTLRDDPTPAELFEDPILRRLK